MVPFFPLPLEVPLLLTYLISSPSSSTYLQLSPFHNYSPSALDKNKANFPAIFPSIYSQYHPHSSTNLAVITDDKRLHFLPFHPSTPWCFSNQDSNRKDNSVLSQPSHHILPSPNIFVMFFSLYLILLLHGCSILDCQRKSLLSNKITLKMEFFTEISKSRLMFM